MTKEIEALAKIIESLTHFEDIPSGRVRIGDFTVEQARELAAKLFNAGYRPPHQHTPLGLDAIPAIYHKVCEDAKAKHGQIFYTSDDLILAGITAQVDHDNQEHK